MYIDRAPRTLKQTDSLPGSTCNTNKPSKNQGKSEFGVTWQLQKSGAQNRDTEGKIGKRLREVN